jgi:hypothetical protein
MIETWERARKESPVERALTILQAAHPNRSREDIAAWTLGTRDRALLRLRTEWFGATARSLAQCPDCAQPLEFDLDVTRFQNEGDPPGEVLHRSSYNEQPYEVAFRLPDSRDQAALAACSEAGPASMRLLERCVLRASRETTEISLDNVPAAILAEVENAFAHTEPEAEILLDLTCPDCQAHWQTIFDISSYLWTEIAYEAQRALWDIHALARAYGWAESAILEMSEPRRRWYLEALNA